MSTLPSRVRPQTFDFSTEPRRRAFGSDYARQNQIYLLRLPFLLGACGAAVWALPTNPMFVLGALVGSLVGLYVLFDIVFRFSPLRLTTVFGMTILLGYNLGSFNTWLTMERGSLTLAESFARDPRALGHAIAACMITSALLFVIGELFERPVFGKEFYLTFGPGTLALVAFTTFLVLGAYATGRIGFGGITLDDTGHPGAITELIVWWYVPAFAYSVCAALNTTGIARWVVRILAFIQGVAMVPLGRRQFAFAMLLALIATRLGRYRLRWPLYKKLFIGVGGVVIVTLASVTFLYLRVAGYELKSKEKISLGMRLETAYSLLQKRSPSDILALLGSSASKRTFVIGFFSDLLDASQRSTPLLGQDILYNLQLTVPSAISKTKFGIGEYGEETLANMHWGFSYRDEANSILTAGAADFGILGVLAYPVLLTLMLRLALEWVQYAVPTNMAVIVTLSYLFRSLQAEATPSGYFLEIRSTILVVILYYFASRLPRFRLRPAA